MHSIRQAFVHRLSAASPSDVSALTEVVNQGLIQADAIVAILGKTEGNGCVNDFTRGLATLALKAAVSGLSGLSLEQVSTRVAFVMSGGTEGGLSPHWLVFEVREIAESLALKNMPATRSEAPPALAIGVAMTAEFKPEEIGRSAQIMATADAVRKAMLEAGITDPKDVHYVQVKCPLLTRQRIESAQARGETLVTQDTYLSMGFSRGASALGVALALGEIKPDQVSDASVCIDSSLYSGRASTSSGIELMQNQIMVLGNSAAWQGDLQIAHAVMSDALDVDAVSDALASLGLQPGRDLRDRERNTICAVLAKAEAAKCGLIRGRRHTMLDDSDIHSSRHARALVGGVLAGVFGETQLFVSGGAEHQGPDGGGPIAVIARF
uniref:Cyanuric acid amidohydrolase n=1 Tax=Polaromonas sp. E10S TaxID=1840239 RepID=A0A2S1FHR5_9BURK|nr:ring-opening amidohydrolase [Polaromonas sp. E10S]AWD71998.1 cyanuric acid hydrolase [Polaromonas sp. E10S]